MYDPLTSDTIPTQQTLPDSYWASTFTPPSWQTLEQDIKVDVAIVGGGFTGLSAAYFLQHQYGARVAVLEANHTGWGCSGRNAGFVLAGTGRLSLAQLEKRWDTDTANGIYQEYLNSVDTLEQMISLGSIDCDKTSGGYIKLAHDAAAGDALQQQAARLQPLIGDKVQFLTPQQSAKLINTPMDHGGLYYPHYFGVNPLKLVTGYARMAADAGAELYTHTPVTSITQSGHLQTLHTPRAKVAAEKVILASNGYSAKKLHPSIENRHFPVLSSVIVSEPLSPEQLARLGMQDGLMAMDSRAMKYYYRLLPDGRLLFGGRGAVQGKDADKPQYAQRLLAGLNDTFPDLGKVEIAYFWSGWVSVSYDDMPRIWTNAQGTLAYAMGYCGSGVAFTAQAGKRLAQSVAGDTQNLPALPFWQSPLPKFPLAPFRRLGLHAFYALAALRG